MNARSGPKLALTLLSLSCAVALAQPASAQTRFGAQASFGDDVDLGLGGRVALGMTERVHLVGTLDVFFPSTEGLDYWEVNANATYSFDEGARPLVPYVGAGLNLARASIEPGGSSTSDSSTDLGLNILGGAQFGQWAVVPYAELRVELGGGDQFVVTGGILFGGGGR